MGLEFSEKLDLLGGDLSQDVDSSATRPASAPFAASACNSCAANPSASVVTHHATRPIRPSEISLPPPRGKAAEGKPPRDLKPWLSSSIRSDGKRIPIVKTLVVQSKSYTRRWLAVGTTAGSHQLNATLREQVVLGNGYGI